MVKEIFFEGTGPSLCKEESRKCFECPHYKVYDYQEHCYLYNLHIYYLKDNILKGNKHG